LASATLPIVLAGDVHAQPSRDVGRYVLLAGDELRVGGLRVTSGDVGVNAGLLRSYEPIDAPVSTLVGDVIHIDARSRCDALYFSDRVELTGRGCGPGAPYSGPLFPDLGVSCGFPVDFPSCSDGAAIQVGHGETLRLAPGSYGDVRVQGGGAGPGRLVLAGGRYVFCNLRAARNAVLDVESPAEVLVTGGLALGQSSRIEFTSGVGPRDLALVVDVGPVSFGRASKIAGHLCAPRALLRIVDGADVTGSFVARVIRGGRGIQADAGPGPSGSTTTTSPVTTSTTAPSSTSTSIPVQTTTTSSIALPTTTTTTSTSLPTTSTESTSTTVASTTSTSEQTTSTATSSTTLPAATTTTTASTTTSTTEPATLCGNCNIDPGETCDDCNTLDGDACPHDCRIESCTPVAGSSHIFSVSFAPPAGIQLQGITVLVDYPEGQVSIPGSGGTPSVKSSIVNLPAGVFAQPNDLDYALRELVAASSGSLAPGPLFGINFQDCQGAAAPTASDFACTVEDASDEFGNPVSGVTCSVSGP